MVCARQGTRQRCRVVCARRHRQTAKHLPIEAQNVASSINGGVGGGLRAAQLQKRSCKVQHVRPTAVRIANGNLMTRVTVLDVTD